MPYHLVGNHTETADSCFSRDITYDPREVSFSCDVSTVSTDLAEEGSKEAANFVQFCACVQATTSLRKVGKMSAINAVYNAIFKRTSTFALAIVVSSFFFERTVDVLTDKIFENSNKGKLWKDIKDKYEK